MTKVRKPQIVVTHHFSSLQPEQKLRLEKLGSVQYFDTDPETPDRWLERCGGKEIICTGTFGLKEKVYELRNVFISVPFVSVSWADRKELREKNIVIANAPGCNSEAVAEWVITVMLSLLRKLPKFSNIRDHRSVYPPERTKSISGKSVCILGAGNVGRRVGELLKAFQANVTFFRRGDVLQEKVHGADIVVNALSHNPSTEGLLGQSFFKSLKKGAYFVTLTSEKVYSLDALLRSLEEGIVAGVATDLGGSRVGNVEDPIYQKLAKYENVIVTPHIAYNTDIAARTCYDQMIENIEQWLKGTPVNTEW